MSAAPLTRGELGLVRLFLDLLPASAPVSSQMARRILATMDQRQADRDAVDALITQTETR